MALLRAEQTPDPVMWLRGRERAQAQAQATEASQAEQMMERQLLEMKRAKGIVSGERPPDAEAVDGAAVLSPFCRRRAAASSVSRATPIAELEHERRALRHLA